jgi:hypothetical protein
MNKKLVLGLVFALTIVSPLQALADTFWQGNGVNIYNLNTGNLGIGTTEPAYKLSVAEGSGNNQLYLRRPAGHLNGTVLETDAEGTFHVSYRNDAGVAISDNNFNITYVGNVGIGIANPTTKLQIQQATGNVALLVRTEEASAPASKIKLQLGGIANAPFGEMQFYAPTGAGSEYLRWNIVNSAGVGIVDAMVIKNDGKVGIGTNLPVTKLDVNGDVSLSNDNALLGNMYYNGGWKFKNPTGFGGGVKFSSLDPAVQFLVGTGNSGANSDANLNIPMVISSSGKVGINTTTPTQALEVNGNIKINGSIMSDGDICIGKCD